MSESRHTPEPFHFDGHGINDRNGQRIAKMSGCGTIHSVVDGRNNPEFDRVGIMLAAAPELLEVCKRIRNSYGETAGDVDTGGAQTVTLTVSYEVMAKLAAAISKATGEKDT